MTGKPVPAGVPHPSAGATATGWAVLPLRLFLGVTFVFAGVQKLADPRFFRASYPGSIQAQLHVAASASPLRPLLDGAGHAPVVVGVLLALGEAPSSGWEPAWRRWEAWPSPPCSSSP